MAAAKRLTCTVCKNVPLVLKNKKWVCSGCGLPHRVITPGK